MPNLIGSRRSLLYKKKAAAGAVAVSSGNWDDMTAPTFVGWTAAAVVGSETFVLQASGSAHSAGNYVLMQAGTNPSWYSTLTRTATFNMTQMPGAKFNIWLYQSPQWAAYNDYFQFQVSDNGGAWTQVGSTAYRYNVSGGWYLFTFDASAYASSTNLQIRFLQHDNYGQSWYLDEWYWSA